MISSKFLATTRNLHILRLHPWESLTPTAVRKIHTNNKTVLLPGNIEPLNIKSILNFNALYPNVIGYNWSNNLQARGMSWGNVNLPVKRHRHRPNVVKDPRWARLRKWKVIRVQLPDQEFDRKIAEGKISPEEIRAEMKLKGILPPTKTMETPVYIASTGAVFEEFRPPEGDGNWNVDRITDTTEPSSWSLSKTLRSSLEKAKSKTFRATRKIRTLDDNFDASNFAMHEGKEVYINAHKALAAKELKKLHQLATEKAYPEMTHNIKGKSIYWEFIKSLEPPKVVQVRVQDIAQKGNMFGQVTVRFHTQQILAIYDRFGRLIHGNPHVSKDVLEYVVFEKHLADTYGKWRLHSKIIPRSAANQRLGGIITHVVKDESDEASNEDEEDEEQTLEEQEKKYGVSYKSDQESSSIADKFGKMIKRS